MENEKKPYCKPALILDEQVKRFIERGMQGDPNRMERHLRDVNYYRFSAYSRPFRIENEDGSLQELFCPNTTFDQIWDRYVLDRELRLLVMDALERIEISVRTRLVYTFSLTYKDPYAYLNRANYFWQDWVTYNHEKFVRQLLEATQKSSEEFVEHFRNTYEKFPELPFWVACEIISFGQLSKLYSRLNRQDQLRISAGFGLQPDVLGSWLHCLSIIRNTCAHHGRLWNRKLAASPKIPNPDSTPANSPRTDWPSFLDPEKPPEDKVKIPNTNVFAVLSICRYFLLEISPSSKWKERLTAILAKHPSVPIQDMGFPENWLDYEIWRDRPTLP